MIVLKKIYTNGACYRPILDGWRWQLFTFPIILQWYAPENENGLLNQLTNILEEDDETQND